MSVVDQLNVVAATSYVPWKKCTSDAMKESVAWKDLLKGEQMIALKGADPIRASALLARWVASHGEGTIFHDVFCEECILVPVPRSSRQKPESLWVGRELCKALANAGIGGQVVECLERTKSLTRSSSQKDPAKRNTVHDHLSSLAVSGLFYGKERIVVVDDIVTQGAQLMGAARVLRAAYPSAEVSAFAAIRTCFSGDDWKGTVMPASGVIDFFDSGKVFCQWG